MKEEEEEEEKGGEEKSSITRLLPIECKKFFLNR